MVQTEMTLITKIVPAKLEQLKQVLAGIKDPSGPDLIALIGTVHFARWVIIDNNKRLLFDSNFDGSVDQYLTDFATQPDLRQALDAVWGCCEGYPAGGAGGDIVKFKQWVHKNMTTAEVFYSAYPDATVRDVKKALAIRDKFTNLLSEFS